MARLGELGIEGVEVLLYGTLVCIVRGKCPRLQGQEVGSRVGHDGERGGQAAILARSQLSRTGI